jgi:hypothetical protein
MPGPRRLRPAVLVLAVLIALTACDLTELLQVDLTGQLLDAGGAPVAGAVVFVHGDGVAGGLATSQAGGDCQAPSEDALASTCTDAQGRYTLRVTTPLVGALTLVFERLYWRAARTIDLGLRVPGEPIEVPDTRFEELAPVAELEAAVRYALPSVARFELITLNTEKEIVDLTNHAGAAGADVAPLNLTLPILQPDGTQQFIPWTAYHHDVREEGILDCAIDAETFQDVDCEEVAGPSLTFQGVPWLDAQEIRNVFIGETEKNLSDEAEFQLSVVHVIGDELDATYYGRQLTAPHTPSSLQGLRSVLDVHYDAETVERLLAGGGANYLLHNQVDLVVGIEDVDLHLDAVPTGAAAQGAGDPIAPANHFLEDGIKVLRPVMVADSTVYDAEARVRLVPNYFARVDAVANRQDLFFAVVQLSAVDAPASLTSLTAWSNAFAVRTRIAGYRRLTESGQAKLSFPTEACSGPGDLIDAYRQLSRDSTTVDNEYWMWWTNTDAYPGGWGCAYTGVLGRTPRDYAVGWTSFRNYTLETVGQTFMHETGHILDAVHGAVTPSHRCRLLGIFEFGVTGPSIMGGTSDRNLRTHCFAVTPPTATSLRNLTRVAEHLHVNLE